jgi:geranylgeranyl diphosphate synthase type 3
MRRGVPTAHRVYGLASTISAALYVYFLALQKVLRFNHPEMIKLYIEMNVESWRGQALDVYWRDNYICPSEEEYMEMITKSKYRVRAMSI